MRSRTSPTVGASYRGVRLDEFVGFALGVALLAGFVSPGILIAGALAMGLTFALRLPAYSALVQEVLPRAALPRAIVWTGGAMNASRTVGPLAAGAIIARARPPSRSSRPGS